MVAHHSFLFQSLNRILREFLEAAGQSFLFSGRPEIERGMGHNPLAPFEDGFL